MANSNRNRNRLRSSERLFVSEEALPGEPGSTIAAIRRDNVEAGARWEPSWTAILRRLRVGESAYLETVRFTRVR